eukprot:gb/GEZN01001908.1/.p1 GENE.gb/GEZN01001908.1/~~gb/GEZN01001908.1/.p1  ORF type:complete len:834 (-),score=63.89 gb/GEZN01001908.1/:117-2618(-)
MLGSLRPRNMPREHDLETESLTPGVDDLEEGMGMGMGGAQGRKVAGGNNGSNSEAPSVLKNGGVGMTRNQARQDNDRSMARFLRGMRLMSCITMGCIVLALSILNNPIYICLVLLIVLGSFQFTTFLTRSLLQFEDYEPGMHRISEYIREGAEGFLSTQYTAIAKFAVVTMMALMCIYLFRECPIPEIGRFSLAITTALSFALGSFCSGLAGYMGVWVSVRVNVRVAIAASKKNAGNALLLCFRGGAVSATLSASMCILGVTMLYLFCYVWFTTIQGVQEKHLPIMLVGYGFGASFVALFMQLGGGIYTKAADVGADMAGKQNHDIPEDDPHNPAVIADLVGDNVGDCAGSMADVFESIAAEIIGTMILGGTLAQQADIPMESFVFFPLVIHALDLVVSAAGIMMLQTSSKSDALSVMKRSYVQSLILAQIAFLGVCRLLLHHEKYPDAWWHFGLCGTVGIVISYLLMRITEYYTSYHHFPVNQIADASKYGHGTNVIMGMAVGLESTGLPIIVICTGLLVSFYLGKTSGLPENEAGVFGTAVATMGMLCTAVFILSMNNFGPIADNAGGIVEMSGQHHSIRVITDELDAVGNVTKAAAKGYAVGGSALACFVLYQAFLDEIAELMGKPFEIINVSKIEVCVGMLVAIALIFVFAGWAMSAVGKVAEKVVEQVQEQWPEIESGRALPNYHKCVSIVANEALREMSKPALLALGVPVGLGFFMKYVGLYTNQPDLGVEVMAAFLITGCLTGLIMAIFLDNAGGAWDNAKKLIERRPDHKGTLSHQAAVTGDTVGDPFKDTAGPALHVIITTMSTTILVLGPLFLNAKVSDTTGF